MTRIQRIGWAVAALLVLIACGQVGGNVEATQFAQETAVAETVAAVQAEQQAETQPPVQPTGASPTEVAAATITPVPTNTQSPPTMTPQPSPTSLPCNWAKFEGETIDDGTEFQTGENFVKTWRLRNIGSCTWTSGYKLIFHHGDRMSAPADVSITSGTVSPGAVVEVAVSLKAPDDPGTYQGNFMLRSPEGIVFGIGDAQSTSFWVNIRAVAPAPASPPDLIVTDIRFDPNPPVKGEQVIVYVDVRNTGETAAGDFWVRWWPGENYSLANTTAVLVDGVNLTTTRTVSFTYVGYPSWYPSLVTKAQADYDNDVAESEEGNNSYTETISVVSP